MIVGDRAVFAIESHISQAFDQKRGLALGYFVVSIKGERYGVFSDDATLLANSYSEVVTRIAMRGGHTAKFATESALDIARAYIGAIYEDEDDVRYFGMTRADFEELLVASSLVWAPDGDEAFDDGSHILQFDIGDCVRLIGFNRDGHSKTNTLRDLTLTAAEFYCTLDDWRSKFMTEWQLIREKGQS